MSTCNLILIVFSQAYYNIALHDTLLVIYQIEGEKMAWGPIIDEESGG